jgi:uncharacterized protein
VTTLDQGARWSRPSPKLWRMRLTELLVTGSVVTVLALAVAAGGGALALGATAVVAVALVALAATFVRNRYRAWGYLERDEDLLVRRGVMFQRLSVVPYGRMQFVEVTAGVMERLFGLSTVKLHTAAARSDARIPGLGPHEAARLRDRLAALGEAKAAGL